jgi:hypothetical protein
MADNFSQSASEATASGREAPSGWYPSPADPDLAQYWDGMQWVGDTRSYQLLNNQALEAIRAQSIMQTAHLQRIRAMVTSFWLVLAITLVAGVIATSGN